MLKNFFYGGVGFKEDFWKGRRILLASPGAGVNPRTKTLFAENQKSLEAFYRFHLTQELAVTASVTHIKDPPLNLTEDEVTLFSIRGRFQM